MSYDVIIIGAGMSGIAAGIRLAHFGKKVAIFERHALPGGLNSYYRRQGCDFDVGLHAMTNFADPKQRAAPLSKLLRQLRLDMADLRLHPQTFSLVRFPGAELRFTNDFRDLEASVAAAFPAQIDGFRRFTARVRAYDALSLEKQDGLMARRVLAEFITDPRLVDMILCPLQFYGSAVEDDMEFGQFVIMFQSIFLEGFARPEGGIRPMIKLLLDRYAECGGEITYRCGVREIHDAPGGGKTVLLDDGRELRANAVLSCAGYVETLRLCDPAPAAAQTHPAGQLTFMESIFVLDAPTASLGFTPCILFFNDAERFHYRRPKTLVDAASGVACAPDNFPGWDAASGPQIENRKLKIENPSGMFRLTQLVDHAAWFAMGPEEYRGAKARVLAGQLALAERLVPGIRPHVVKTDLFTPRTVERFTGHLNGNVYGSPVKSKDGTTPVPGVYVCGTDQGFLGIIGSLLSGVSIANKYFLR